MTADSNLESSLQPNAIAGHAPCSQFHRNCTCRDCVTYVTLRTGANAEQERIVNIMRTRAQEYDEHSEIHLRCRRTRWAFAAKKTREIEAEIQGVAFKVAL